METFFGTPDHVSEQLHLKREARKYFKALAERQIEKDAEVEPASQRHRTVASEQDFERLAASFLLAYGPKIWPAYRPSWAHLLEASQAATDGYWDTKRGSRDTGGPVFVLHSESPSWVRRDWGKKHNGVAPNAQTVLVISPLGKMVVRYLRALVQSKKEEDLLKWSEDELLERVIGGKEDPARKRGTNAIADRALPPSDDGRTDMAEPQLGKFTLSMEHGTRRKSELSSASSSDDDARETSALEVDGRTDHMPPYRDTANGTQSVSVTFNEGRRRQSAPQQLDPESSIHLTDDADGHASIASSLEMAPPFEASRTTQAEEPSLTEQGTKVSGQERALTYQESMALYATLTVEQRAEQYLWETGGLGGLPYSQK